MPKEQKTAPAPKQEKRYNLNAGYELELMEREQRARIASVKRQALISQNPLMRAMFSNPVEMHVGYDVGSRDVSIASLTQAPSSKPNLPNFVDGQDGKFLLSKGVLPSATIMRHDIGALTSNWHDIETKHRILKAELDAIDSELSEREVAIKRKMKEATNSTHSTNTRFANNAVIKPGSNVCGSGFNWSNTYKPSYKDDYIKPESLFDDPVKNGISKIRTQYGSCTKVCDLPEPSIYVNPLAPYNSRCKVTKSDINLHLTQRK
jgi:hypothetical protein